MTTATPTIYDRAAYERACQRFARKCSRLPGPCRAVTLPRGRAGKGRQFAALYQRADEAGTAAAKAAGVVPMVVQQHARVMDDASPVVKQWFVEGGVCGFAWVQVKPANCGFAKWLVESGHARKGHEPGVCLWVHQFGQSLQRKEAYAHAFARVLCEAGVKCYSQSRMD